MDLGGDGQGFWFHKNQDFIAMLDGFEIKGIFFSELEVILFLCINIASWLMGVNESDNRLYANAGFYLRKCNG